MAYGYSKRSVDGNHTQIVNELRKLGFSVCDTHALPKFVDIVVGYEGVNYMFEIKTDHKKKLTKDEKELKEIWQGQYAVITSSTEAVDLIFLNNPPF